MIPIMISNQVDSFPRFLSRSDIVRLINANTIRPTYHVAYQGVVLITKGAIPSVPSVRQ